MTRKICNGGMLLQLLALLLVASSLLVVPSSANSQDDNLEDKLRGTENQGPQLPTVDNIVQASKDNLDLILTKQLKENM